MIFVTSGGSGGLSPNDAIIHVTAHVGSTISFSKDGVVAKVLGPEKSHINADDNTLADWYYIVSSNNYGTWTVTATLDSDSASNTITVSTNQQYDVVLIFEVFLVKYANTLVVPTISGSGNNATYTNAPAKISMPSGTHDRYINWVDIANKPNAYVELVTSAVSIGSHAFMWLQVVYNGSVLSGPNITKAGTMTIDLSNYPYPTYEKFTIRIRGESGTGGNACTCSITSLALK